MPTNVDNIKIITGDEDHEGIYSDLAKLTIILLVSVLFMGIIIIIFHFWRIFRKDKLKCKPINS